MPEPVIRTSSATILAEHFAANPTKQPRVLPRMTHSAPNNVDQNQLSGGNQQRSVCADSETDLQGYAVRHIAPKIKVARSNRAGSAIYPIEIRQFLGGGAVVNRDLGPRSKHAATTRSLVFRRFQRVLADASAAFRRHARGASVGDRGAFVAF